MNRIVRLAVFVLAAAPAWGQAREFQAPFLEKPYLQLGDAPSLGAGPGRAEAPAQTVKEAEKQLIMRALKEAAGNRTLAAKRIGMSRRTLHRKLHEYQLENL